MQKGRTRKRAVVHLVALGAVVTDLLLNRARVEVRDRFGQGLVVWDKSSSRSQLSHRRVGWPSRLLG